jgi:hypothetical protein
MAWLIFWFRTVGMDNIYKAAVNVVNKESQVASTMQSFGLEVGQQVNNTSLENLVCTPYYKM